jgi:transcriptional regulator with XRE-family HTH domain
MTAPGTRIYRARLAAGFENQSDFARRLGVTRQAVSAWENGISAPGQKQLANIALLTGVNYDYLATGRGNSRGSLGVGKAKIVGIVEAEAWREGISMQKKMESDDDGEEGTVPSIPYEGLAGFRQFAVQARGESANLALRAGEYAIYVSYLDVRPYGPQSGDLVVLEKRRDGEFKHWIARLHLIEGRWEAHFESSDLRWQNEPQVRFDKDFKRDERDNNEVEIIGCVMSAIRHLYQPTSLSPAPKPKAPKSDNKVSFADTMMGLGLALQEQFQVLEPAPAGQTSK